jgi:hypothetical protein
MSATKQQKDNLLLEIKILRRKSRSKCLEKIELMHRMSMGEECEPARNVEYSGWSDEDFKDVLKEINECFIPKNFQLNDQSSNKKFEFFQKEEKIKNESIMIENIECLVVGRTQKKFKNEYKNYIDSRIGNLLKTDAIEERKQNCIDPYGLVSKKDSKDLIEPSMKIAVVTSAWKTHDYIEQFLDSIENNTMHPYVVLIGVDACEDTKNSLNEILNKKKYSFEIKTFYSNENVGTYNIRNNLNDLAFDEHDCDAIVCMDSDDMFHHEYIQSAHDALIKNPDSVVASNIIFNFYHETGSKKSIDKYNTGVNSFSKKIWKKVGYYLPTRASADTEWIYRCFKLKQIIIVSNSLLYYRRIHENQLTQIYPVIKDNPARTKALEISNSNLIIKVDKKKMCFENKD